MHSISQVPYSLFCLYINYAYWVTMWIFWLSDFVEMFRASDPYFMTRVSSCALPIDRCLPPPLVGNATVSYDSDNRLATFRCFEGYLFPTGNEERNETCNPDGTWNRIPSCESMLLTWQYVAYVTVCCLLDRMLLMWQNVAYVTECFLSDRMLLMRQYFARVTVICSLICSYQYVHSFMWQYAAHVTEIQNIVGDIVSCLLAPCTCHGIAFTREEWMPSTQLSSPIGTKWLATNEVSIFVCFGRDMHAPALRLNVLLNLLNWLTVQMLNHVENKNYYYYYE